MVTVLLISRAVRGAWGRIVICGPPVTSAADADGTRAGRGGVVLLAVLARRRLSVGYPPGTGSEIFLKSLG